MPSYVSVGSGLVGDDMCSVCMGHVSWFWHVTCVHPPLVLCALLMYYLQVRHPLRDWRKLGKCHKVIQHSPGGGEYVGVAVNSEGFVAVAVTDDMNKCIHLLKANWWGPLGKECMLGSNLYAITFDLKGNVWVVDRSHKKVLKLSQDGQLLQTLDHEGL